MDGESWVLLDTETTGIVAPIYVVDLAAQRMRGWHRDGPSFRRLLNQNVSIPSEASRVHGYTREILERDGEDPIVVYNDFADYSSGLPLVSFNVQYDLDQVLYPEWKRLGIAPIGTRGFCVMKLAQRLLDPVPAGNCKLQTLRQFYRLPERGAHTAMGDVETVADLLEGVLWPLAKAKNLESWEAVCRYISAPWYPTKISFGDYRGHDFREAKQNIGLRNWLETLAKSKNTRNAQMGSWYLHKLALQECSSEQAPCVIESEVFRSVSRSDGSAARFGVVVYTNPELVELQRIVELARARLAALEAEYTEERRAVDSTQSQLFVMLHNHYRKRDQLQLVVSYRRRFLDLLIQEGEEEAQVASEQYNEAKSQSDKEYERAENHSAECKPLSSEDKQEIRKLWRKLVQLFHPDRFANDPEKMACFQKLTSQINRARDEANIDLLREIANDPDGFIVRMGLSHLDFTETREIDGLRRLYASLQLRIVEAIELLNALKESPEYEIYKLDQKDRRYLQKLAEDHKESIDAEITELERLASQLDSEISELIGKRSGVG